MVLGYSVTTYDYGRFSQITIIFRQKCEIISTRNKNTAWRRLGEATIPHLCFQVPVHSLKAALLLGNTK